MTEQELIKKGFNHGYDLQNRDKEWAQTLGKSLKNISHPYAEGFRNGRNEKMKEQGIYVEEFGKNKDRNVDHSLEI